MAKAAAASGKSFRLFLFLQVSTLWPSCWTEEESTKKQLAEFRRLKSQVKALKKKLSQQEGVDNNDPQDQDEIHLDPDCLSPESEEENEVELDLLALVSPGLLTCVLLAHLTVTVEIQQISTITAKPPTQKIKPHIQRCEGSAPPTASPQPQLCPASELAAGNPVSETNLAPTQTSPTTSQGSIITTDKVHCDIVCTHSNH